MTESEPKLEYEPNEEWKEVMRSGVSDALDLYEAFDNFVEPSPNTLSASLDERGFDELTGGERKYLREVMEELVGLGSEAEVVRTADLDLNEKGVGRVEVYRTDRSIDENMFFHVLTYEDGEEVFYVAPQDYDFSGDIDEEGKTN